MIKKVKIISNISYQEFPITEDMIEIEDSILKEIGKTKQFDDNGNIIPFQDNSKRIIELKSLLAKTDYQAIKFAEGELSAEEYLPIKQKRRSYRAEINSLEEKLKNFA